MKYIFELPKIDTHLLERIEEDYINQEGNEINDKLSKLFQQFPDDNNIQEVTIKVAALNTIYSTAIMNISPVVKLITEQLPEDIGGFEMDDFIRLVDEISTVEWTNVKSGKSYRRNNLSFASKYVHFLSSRKTPIYDSYIWIIMTGYRIQSGLTNSFATPMNYREFYDIFESFKSKFKLDHLSNYQIDKFLWQFGKNKLLAITEENNVSLSKAKSILEKDLKTRKNKANSM